MPHGSRAQAGALELPRVARHERRQTTARWSDASGDERRFGGDVQPFTGTVGGGRKGGFCFRNDLPTELVPFLYFSW